MIMNDVIPALAMGTLECSFPEPVEGPSPVIPLDHDEA
jgi:hypothetical protein